MTTTSLDRSEIEHYVAAMRSGPLLQLVVGVPSVSRGRARARHFRRRRDGHARFVGRTGWTQVSAPLTQPSPRITATLRDGPLAGRDLEVDVVEGRPPKIINVPLDEANTCRYCLAAWTQSGPSAIYTFLYRV